MLNPTLAFQVGDILKLPILPLPAADVVESLRDHALNDWDAFERSIDFSSLPLALPQEKKLEDAYGAVANQWRDQIADVERLEGENNRVFIDAYRLEGDMAPAISIDQITLTCNPAHRYDSDKSESELETLLLADTMREFISYALGCMLGRYSLDKLGLILANHGETAHDYFRLTILDFGLKGEYQPSRLEECVKACKFSPDEDNVIPILDGDWFDDDISKRFKDFLKVTFGTEHYDENLEFLENALYPDNSIVKNRKTIRDYFLKEFYDHHLKMYKKRPIYWLFSSPKGTFNALIYMHRYRPETVGKVLECLRDFREKLAHHAEHRQMTADSASASKTEKTQAIKDVATIKKQLKELEDYEKTLFEVAARKIEIDLDNGVKHNYPLFGSVLRKINGF